MSEQTDFTDIVEAVVEDDTLTATTMEHVDQPRSCDPEWSEFLLDQLTDAELVNGAPTVDGLRRVCEKHFGEIISSHSQIAELPSSANNGRCTIKHTIMIVKYDGGREIAIDGAVDVVYGKTPAPFRDHLVATADTRAEGKALRRALKIKVITAEELQNEDEEEAVTDEPINDQQIMAVNQLCKRLDISVKSFVTGEYNRVATIRDLQTLQGRLLVSKLSDFQRNPKSVPDEYRVYDENWKQDFQGSAK